MLKIIWVKLHEKQRGRIYPKWGTSLTIIKSTSIEPLLSKLAKYWRTQLLCFRCKENLRERKVSSSPIYLLQIHVSMSPLVGLTIQIMCGTFPNFTSRLPFIISCGTIIVLSGIDSEHICSSKMGIHEPLWPLRRKRSVHCHSICFTLSHH